MRVLHVSDLHHGAKSASDIAITTRPLLKRVKVCKNEKKIDLHVFKRSLSLVLFSAIAMFGLTGCGRSYTYNYKLTVSVADHGSVRTSSNVVRVREIVASTGSVERPRLCGEANVVSLGSGRHLFALLNGPPHDPIVGKALWDRTPTILLLQRIGLPLEHGWQTDVGIKELPERRDRVILEPVEMPEFVAFQDEQDPTTIRRVNPDNLTGMFGAGVKLMRVTLEPTKEEPTRGTVERALNWFEASREYVDSDRASQAVTKYHSYQFSRCSWFFDF